MLLIYIYIKKALKMQSRRRRDNKRRYLYTAAHNSRLALVVSCTPPSLFICFQEATLLLLPCQHPRPLAPSSPPSSPLLSSSLVLGILSTPHPSVHPSVHLLPLYMHVYTHSSSLILSLVLFCDLGQRLTKRLHTAGL